MKPRTLRIKNSNKKILIDQKDYISCCKINWKLNKKGYVKAGDGIGLLHRFILRDKLKRNPFLTVHHRNGNKLDNRRGNLQILTIEEHVRTHQEAA
jgi:hypothetical protein